MPTGLKIMIEKPMEIPVKVQLIHHSLRGKQLQKALKFKCSPAMLLLPLIII